MANSSSPPVANTQLGGRFKEEQLSEVRGWGCKASQVDNIVFTRLPLSFQAESNLGALKALSSSRELLEDKGFNALEDAALTKEDKQVRLEIGVVEHLVFPSHNYIFSARNPAGV